MSNKVSITPTEFKNIRTGQIQYGFRIYDNYVSSFVDVMTKDGIPDDNMTFLEEVHETRYHNEAVNDLMVYLEDNAEGVTVGDKWYDYDEIAWLFQDV